MADLDYVEAKDLIEEARSHGLAYIDAVKTLWLGRAWLAMEYPSWDALVREELGDLPRLPASTRRGAATDMASIGMSSRAIAPVVGAHRSTVDADINGGGNPPPSTVIGLDGVEQPRQRTAPQRVEVDESIDLTLAWALQLSAMSRHIRQHELPPTTTVSEIRTIITETITQMQALLAYLEGTE